VWSAPVLRAYRSWCIYAVIPMLTWGRHWCWASSVFTNLQEVYSIYLIAILLYWYIFIGSWNSTTCRDHNLVYKRVCYTCSCHKMIYLTFTNGIACTLFCLDINFNNRCLPVWKSYAAPPSAMFLCYFCRCANSSKCLHKNNYLYIHVGPFSHANCL